MIKKQILRAQKHSRKDLLEREETKTSQQKLTFNITYYPNFQNTRNILQELLLAPHKEDKKVFANVPVVVFRNAKSLKDYLVRATLPKTNQTGRCEEEHLFSLQLNKNYYKLYSNRLCDKFKNSECSPKLQLGKSTAPFEK